MQDQLPSTHPVAADVATLSEAIANFDGISYAKGASVLRQLVATIGRESFFAGIRAYFAEYGWGNATLADWLCALEASSGRSWATGPRSGWRRPARVRCAGLRDGRRREVHRVRGAAGGARRASGPAAAPPRDRPVQPATDGALVRTHQVRADIAGPRTEIPELAGAPAGLDPAQRR